MSPPADDPRRYSDDEVEEILDRASELARELPARSTPDSGGLTLEELEQIAGEAGIDPSLIRQAASDLAGTPERRSHSSFLGGPTELFLEREVEGEIPTSAAGRLVSAIEHEVGAGAARAIGRTLSWRSRIPARDLLVTVESREGRTLIRLRESLRPTAGGLFGGIVGGVGGGVGFGVGLGVGIGALASPAFAVLFPAGVIGGSYVLARAIFARVARAREEELTRIAEALERRAGIAAQAAGDEG